MRIEKCLTHCPDTGFQIGGQSIGAYCSCSCRLHHIAKAGLSLAHVAADVDRSAIRIEHVLRACVRLVGEVSKVIVENEAYLDIHV